MQKIGAEASLLTTAGRKRCSPLGGDASRLQGSDALLPERHRCLRPVVVSDGEQKAGTSIQVLGAWVNSCGLNVDQHSVHTFFLSFQHVEVMQWDAVFCGVAMVFCN